MGERIRAATPEEAPLLSQLALRSKGHWGYEPDFLDACRAQLTLTSEYISACPVFVYEKNDQIIGFYGLDGQGHEAQLLFLFVEPTAIGCGYGKLLWQHAVCTASQLGFRFLIIESDPFAETFYRAMGANRIAEVPSTLKSGRMLPLLRFLLRQGFPLPAGLS